MIAENDTVSTSDRLSFTFFLAIAMHAMLIFGVSFKVESGDKLAPTLNITLATHQSHREPDKADFLAQFNQEASGTEQELKELTTRQKAEIADANVRDITPVPQQKAISPSERNAQVVTTNNRAARDTQAALTHEEQQAQAARDGAHEDTPLVNPEIASLQAKLDRMRQELAKQPRVRRLTSVATKASEDAAYLSAWAQQVEQVGNENFPEEALRRKMFGNLRMAVTLYPNGTVARVDVLQSSGHRLLDDAAVQIVHMAAPFPPFPPEIRKNADQLEIIRTWRFEIRGLTTSSAL